MNPEFTPNLWPEESAPPEAAGCVRCELCKQTTRVVWGEGNPGAPILAVLDNPGAREDRDGNEFVCGARRMLQTAAHEAGLSADELYVTFILKCRPRRKYDKDVARAVCMEHLTGQLRQKQIKLAICLGNTATQWFFGDLDLEVKKMRGSWYTVRGLPTAVTYHPLAVSRRPNLYRLFLSDWEMLARRYFNEM